MPTKAKITKPATAVSAIEAKLSQAIEMASEGKASESAKIFQAVAKESIEQGNFGVAKVANDYLVHGKAKMVVSPDADPIQEAVFLLNAGQPEATLEKLEKLMKAKNVSAHMHYLKALAYACSQQFELSAQSLRDAIEMEPAMLNVYRLEPDFKSCRRSSLFAEFELA